MNAKEAEVVAGAQAGHQQALLRLGWGGLFDHVLDDVHPLATRHTPAADGAIVGKEALAGGLYSRDGARLGLRQGDDLASATVTVRVDVEVIADEVQEGLAVDEGARAEHGVTVTEGLLLLHEGQPAAVLARRGGVGRLVARADDDADLFDAGAQRLLDDDAEDRLFRAVAVDEGLQRQRALVASGRGDHRPGHSHGPSSIRYRPRQALRLMRHTCSAISFDSFQ